MNPRFEEHDGQLFRMLEKPVQLKEKNTNVLVQFITHGAIGEYVMEHWLDCNQKNVPIFVKDVDSDGDVTVCIENGNEHICCPFPMFEIIGYPVEEGSHWWALYQMMQGEKVTKRHLSHTYWQYDARPHLKCISEYNCGTLQIMVLPEIWLTTAEPTGWQIYKESNPEPAKEQFEVGDWVTDGVVVGHVAVINDGKAWVKTKDAQYHLSVEHIRKLKPSEVVIHIGCLSGTIEDLSYAEDGRFWFIGGKTERCPGGMHGILYLEMLDTQTRELVESLLKAQKGETK